MRTGGSSSGSQGGGASLTPHGEAVLACYEAMLADISRVTESYQGQLGGWLRDGAIDLVRIVRGEKGTVRMRQELVLRFGYGTEIPWVTQPEPGVLGQPLVLDQQPRGLQPFVGLFRQPGGLQTQAQGLRAPGHPCWQVSEQLQAARRVAVVDGPFGRQDRKSVV